MRTRIIQTILLFMLTIQLFGAHLARSHELIQAAHWFGYGWPVNMWGTDLVRYADRDFKKIKADGFNAVIILVPYPGFGAPDFERLQELVAIARRNGLAVLFRASYEWNSLEPKSAERMLRLWETESEYLEWQQYIDRLARIANESENVKLVFISWESFLSQVGYGLLTPAWRLEMAKRIGFSGWVQRRLGMEEIQRNHPDLLLKGDVLIPERYSPDYKLYLEYLNESLVARFFTPLRARTAKASLEVRVDGDPVYGKSHQVKEWYDSTPTWKDIDANPITTYFNPYMGQANANGQFVSAASAVKSLRTMLARTTLATGKKSFIDQLVLIDETPEFKRNDRLRKTDVPAFLRASEKVIRTYTDGYAFWTYRDYEHNAVPSPRFYRGLTGWDSSGTIHLAGEGIELPPGGWIERTFSKEELQGASNPGHVTICASLANASSLKVSLSSGEFDNKYAVTSERPCVDAPIGDPFKVRVSANQDAKLRELKIFSFTQRAGIHNSDGSPGFLRDSIRQFNKEIMLHNSVEIVPLYPDHWMGKYFVTTLKPPIKVARSVQVRTFLPDSWPFEPQLSITVGDRTVVAPCRHGANSIKIPVKDGTASAGKTLEHTVVQIAANRTAVPKALGLGPDVRDLGCVIRRVGWARGK